MRGDCTFGVDFRTGVGLQTRGSDPSTVHTCVCACVACMRACMCWAAKPCARYRTEPRCQKECHNATTLKTSAIAKSGVHLTNCLVRNTGIRKLWLVKCVRLHTCDQAWRRDAALTHWRVIFAARAGQQAAPTCDPRREPACACGSEPNQLPRALCGETLPLVGLLLCWLRLCPQTFACAWTQSCCSVHGPMAVSKCA